MSESKVATLDAMLALMIRVASAGLVFGLQVLLARLMPTDGYGGFVALWTWMLALGSFAALGFAESSVRFLPRYHLRQRAEAVRAFWRFGLILVIGFSLLVTVAAAVFAGMASLEEQVAVTVLLVALGLPFLAIEYFVEGVARSFGWFRLAAVPVYIVRPILIGGCCLLLVQQGWDLTLPLVGAVLLGSMGVVALYLVVVVSWRLARLSAGTRNALRGQRQLWLRASLPLLLMSGIEDLTGYADVLLLSLFAAPEQVGIYFAAARCLALAGFVAYAMTLVAGRRFALDLAGAKRAELQRNILQSTRLTFWATLASVAIAIAVGPVMLSAFGEEFLGGYVAMWILGGGMIVRSIAGQGGEVLIVTGRQREGIGIGIFSLVVSLLVGIVLIPMMSLVGAACAAAAGMTCRTLGIVIVLQRTEKLRVVALGLPVAFPGRSSA